MASENEGVKIVAIDSDGVFKYILIKVTTEKGAFNIVRGSALPIPILQLRRAVHPAPRHTLACARRSLSSNQLVSRSSQICLGGVSRRYVPACFS